MIQYEDFFMQRYAFFLMTTIFCLKLFTLDAQNACRKCHILRDYHENHPSKYEYYEDYLKDVEGKRGQSIRGDELPPDVKFIMDKESVSE